MKRFGCSECPCPANSYCQFSLIQRWVREAGNDQYTINQAKSLADFYTCECVFGAIDFSDGTDPYNPLCKRKLSQKIIIIVFIRTSIVNSF